LHFFFIMVEIPNLSQKEPLGRKISRLIADSEKKKGIKLTMSAGQCYRLSAVLDWSLQRAVPELVYDRWPGPH